MIKEAIVKIVNKEDLSYEEAYTCLLYTSMKAIEAEMKRKEEEARKKAEAQKKTYNVTNLGNISFKWPCPSSGRITSGFGGRKSPTKGASSNHQGIDISASTGACLSLIHISMCIRDRCKRTFLCTDGF